ncbi:hypothetical protein SAMN04488136_10726 [Vibrio xiamenensis]|uniref:Uncharacterized protein n=1 Tax=Vibrio xiamenensis TaxID=861298 RepID=A0A1G7Z6G7_9VIBR|nr:hypothetical protein [Vibrio xiamenensis]SDH04343.1 hypothetical protein SAMN04488136_10726 [Vibrio xiamenensis]
MNKDTSNLVLKKVKMASDNLCEAIEVVRNDGDEEELKKISKKVAVVLSGIYHEIIKPIIVEYPELDNINKKK